MNKKFILFSHIKINLLKIMQVQHQFGLKIFYLPVSSKKQIKVIGSTENTKNLYSKKIILNIPISNYKILSKSDLYTNKIINYCKKNNPALLKYIIDPHILEKFIIYIKILNSF